jgi:hypothetical protein
MRLAEKKQGKKRAEPGGLNKRSTMPTRTKPDPFDEGCRAAAEGIPAEANPYPAGTDKHALWSDGHEVGAQALESGQSEDS